MSHSPAAASVVADERAERGGSWSVAAAPADVVLISDSALAGIRWTGNLHRLVGANWDARLESCRRLVFPSCRGRERVSPPTVLEELGAIGAAGGAIDGAVLIVATGHNDWETRFGEDLRAVLLAARAAGFERVGWLLYRSNVAYQLPRSSQATVANYAAMNQILRAEVASGSWPELVLLDYEGHTAAHPEWFTPDGVHLTPEGGAAIADWLSGLIRYSMTPALAPDNWLQPTS